MVQICNYSGKKISLMASLFFICNILFGQKIEFGSNSGNIINGGLMAYDSEHTFFTNLDSTTKGLYSIELNGKGLKKISDHLPSFMNVLNGWLYFDETRGNLTGIYKMKTDGSEGQRLS